MSTDRDSRGGAPGLEDGAPHSSPGGSRDGDLRTLGSGAGIGLVGRGGGRLVQFVSHVLLARSLAPAGYGVFSLSWTILRMGAFVAMSGLQNGVVRFGSEQRLANPGYVRTVIRRCLSLGLVTGTAVGLVIFFSADRLAGSVFAMPDLAPALKILAVSFPLLAVARIAAASTRVSQRMFYSVIAEDFGQPLAFLGLVGVLVFALGLGLTGALWALTGGYAVSLALSLLFLHGLFPRTPRTDAASSTGERPPGARVLMTYSLPTALAAMLSHFILWTDRLFLGFFGVADQVGIYEAIAQLTVPFLMVLAAFNAVFAPMVVSLQADRARIEELFRISTRWGLYTSLPYFLTIVFAGRELIELLFGVSYSSGFVPLLILAVGQLVNVGTGGIAMLLIMTGHQHRWLQISASSLGLNLILNGYLVPKLDLVGAALATGIATGIMFIAGVWVTRRHLGLWAYDRRYWKGVLSVVLTTFVLLAERTAFHLPSLAWVVLTVATAGGVFLASLRLLGLESEDRQLLELVGSRIGSSFRAW